MELEYDATNVVKDVCDTSTGRTPMDLMIEDTRMLSTTFNHFSCCHVRRAGNVVAHLAARLLPPNVVKYVFQNSFPQGISSLAELDLMN